MCKQIIVCTFLEATNVSCDSIGGMEKRFTIYKCVRFFSLGTDAFYKNIRDI